MAIRCKDERTCEETRCCRNEPGSEFSRTCEDHSKWPHNYRTSRANVPHTPRESLLELATTTQAQARRQNGGPRCEYVDVENVYDATQQAAVHHGNDYLENVHSTKNLPQRTVKQMFDVTRKLGKDQKGIQVISVINWQLLGKGRRC